MADRSPSPGGVTARAVLIGVLLIPVKAQWIAVSEMMTGTTEITCTSLFIGVTFILFVLVALNPLLERLNPRWRLAPGELITIYVMLSLATAVGGIGVIGFLTPALCNLYYYHNETNRWSELWPLLPRWFAPDPQTDGGRAAIDAFFNGHATFWQPEFVRAWLAPLGVWSAFLLVVLVTTLCLMAILRRPWVERERLTFPIVYLPLEMVRSRGEGSFLRRRLFWLGFFLAASLQSHNSISFLYPVVPYIPVKPIPPLDLGLYLKQRPWNALGYFPLAFHPNTIGLAFLLSLDVSFSCWFFYLLRKAGDVAAVAVGFRDPGSPPGLARFPYSTEQSVGAWLMIALLALWLSRDHLSDVWRATVARRGAVDDRGEPIAFRWATLGFVAGTAALVWFGTALGMSLAPAAGLVAAWLLYMITMARIRAEAGCAWTFGPWHNPCQLVVRWAGSGNLSPRTLTALGGSMWFHLDYRCASPGHQIEAFKLAGTLEMNQRRLAWAMLAATVLGIVCSLWFSLSLYYEHGAATARVNPWRKNMGLAGWNHARAWLDVAQPPDLAALGGGAVGAALTLLLIACRTRLLWWPFHPLGYAVGYTFIMDLLWCPFLVAWAIKLALLRAGGMKAYRRAVPFFLGLILGDYVAASLWTIGGAISGVSMYRCFPN